MNSTPQTSTVVPEDEQQISFVIDRYHVLNIQNEKDIGPVTSMIEFYQNQSISNTFTCAEACLDFNLSTMKKTTEGIHTGLLPQEQYCLQTCYKKLTAGSDLFLKRNFLAMKRHQMQL